MSIRCPSTILCDGSSDLDLRTVPSGIRSYEYIWMSTVVGNLVYDIRNGGAFVLQVRSFHIIDEFSVALQRPALVKTSDNLTRVKLLNESRGVHSFLVMMFQS